MKGLTRSSVLFSSPIYIPRCPTRLRLLSTTRPLGQLTPSNLGKNRVLDLIRNPDALHTALRLSSSAGRPLITLWTTSWCPSCRVIEPIITSVIEDEGAGEQHGGVVFAKVEMDAPDMLAQGMGGAGEYIITSVPTLLSFRAGEPAYATKVSNVDQLKDRRFLAEWIQKETSEGKSMGGGGIPLGRIFGGLFGGKHG